MCLGTNQFVSSSSNMMLTKHDWFWQKCGQRSSITLGSTRQVLNFWIFPRKFVIWMHMFSNSKCRRESNLRLCTTSKLAVGMPPRPHNDVFWWKNTFGHKICSNSPTRWHSFCKLPMNWVVSRESALVREVTNPTSITFNHVVKFTAYSTSSHIFESYCMPGR